MKNKWKVAFLILFSFTLLGVLFVTYKVFVPSARQIKTEQKSLKYKKQIEIKLNQNQLSTLSNYYLQQKKSQWRIMADKDDFILSHPYKIMNRTVYINFFVRLGLDQGNIVFKIKQITLGNLSLPKTYVLQFVKNNVNLKGLAKIDDRQEKIVLQFGNLKNKIAIKGKEFNPKSNEYIFDIFFQ